LHLDISELVDRFPDFRVAALVFDRLSIADGRAEELAALIAGREVECRRLFGATELSAIAGVAAWRQAYRAFGIKKTSYRSSVERLVKNVLADRPLPAINSFVDAYNAVSLAHVLPIGADDLALVAGDVAFRYSRPGDSFRDMAGEEGGEGPVDDPPKEGEVVYADAEKVLCRRWNWRQDARSLVSTATTRAIVTIQSNGEGDVEAASSDLAGLVGRFCGGSVTIGIAHRANPRVALGG
jgi:DNA/RNA-binding domain of Phe-tRNA-synthetase-like protein